MQPHLLSLVDLITIVCPFESEPLDGQKVWPDDRSEQCMGPIGKHDCVANGHFRHKQTQYYHSKMIIFCAFRT